MIAVDERNRSTVHLYLSVSFYLTVCFSLLKVIDIRDTNNLISKIGNT